MNDQNGRALPDTIHAAERTRAPVEGRLETDVRVPGM